VPKISSHKTNENPPPWQQHSKLKIQFNNATSGSIHISNPRAINQRAAITIDGEPRRQRLQNYSHSANKKSEQASLMCYAGGQTAAVPIIDELALS
jgi:hypothetical protein